MPQILPASALSASPGHMDETRAQWFFVLTRTSCTKDFLFLSYGLPADLATPGELPNTTNAQALLYLAGAWPQRTSQKNLGLGHY